MGRSPAWFVPFVGSWASRRILNYALRERWVGLHPPEHQRATQHAFGRHQRRIHHFRHAVDQSRRRALHQTLDVVGRSRLLSRGTVQCQQRFTNTLQLFVQLLRLVFGLWKVPVPVDQKLRKRFSWAVWFGSFVVDRRVHPRVDISSFFLDRLPVEPQVHLLHVVMHLWYLHDKSYNLQPLDHVVLCIHHAIFNLLADHFDHSRRRVLVHSRFIQRGWEESVLAIVVFLSRPKDADAGLKVQVVVRSKGHACVEHRS